MTYDTQVAVKIALMIVMVIAAIAMIVIVMMQQGTNDNIGAITGATDTFYGRNKAKSAESRLKKITYFIFALLIITSVIYFIISFIDVGVVA